MCLLFSQFSKESEAYATIAWVFVFLQTVSGTPSSQFKQVLQRGKKLRDNLIVKSFSKIVA